MSARPNFTRVVHIGGSIVVSGTSGPGPFDDIILIQVLLSQGRQTVASFIEFAGNDWSATIPAEGFSPGPAIVVGVETRRENATTTTWVEAMELPIPQ
jgi:hypothetical protein